MSSAEIKNKIHKALQDIEDSKFLKAVYAIISEKAESNQFFELSEEQKAILDEREKEYKQGKGKSYTWQEAKKMIRSKKDAA